METCNNSTRYSESANRTSHSPSSVTFFFRPRFAGAAFSLAVALAFGASSSAAPSTPASAVFFLRPRRSTLSPSAPVDAVFLAFFFGGAVWSSSSSVFLGRPRDLLGSFAAAAPASGLAGFFLRPRFSGFGGSSLSSSLTALAGALGLTLGLALAWTGDSLPAWASVPPCAGSSAGLHVLWK